MRILPVLCLLALPLPALAETLSAEIGRSGIAATEGRLAALPQPDTADLFALAGLRFLAALEHAMQERWHYGVSDRTGMLPFLRAPLVENPAPAPYDPALIARIFRDTAAAMDQTRAALGQIPPDSDFAVEIDFADIWFDINANHSRDPGEDMMQILGPMLMGREWDSRDPATPAPVVRFDSADAPWLAAYTHLIGGLADVILAYDPTEPTARVLGARASMMELGPMSSDYIFGSGAPSTGPDEIDLIAIILATLNQSPEAARMASARDHFLAMIAENRRFWAEVDRETDDRNEWLPNDRQHSALGIPVPPGTGTAWVAMLGDLERILNDGLLVPYWRYDNAGGAGVGLNVAKIFTDPRPVDVAGWIHGWAALPYLEKGSVAGPESTAALDSLMMGNPMLMALYLN